MRIPMAAFGLALLCCGNAAAQGMGAGVRGGANLASVTFDGDGNNPSFDRRIGAVAGVFVTVPLVSWLEVQPEVLYTSKGARLDQDGIESTLVLDYLEVPLLARVSGNAFGTSRFYVLAGPSVGFNLRARTRTDFGSSTEEMDLRDDVERLDLGVAVGAGLEFGSWVIDGRYTHGLSDIDKDTTDLVTITNRAFTMSAGFRF